MTTRRRTIHDLLAGARARYRRLDPAEAFVTMQAGALLVDTRTDGQRSRDGEVTDVIGGFEAWRAAGLPVRPGLGQPGR